jgi:hypothetical protein
MENGRDRAFVVSTHYDNSEGVLQINLNWEGDHEIDDFDLDMLGNVLHCESETRNTGWVLIEPRSWLSTCSSAALPLFGPQTLETSIVVTPGQGIPLREKAVSTGPVNLVLIWYSLNVCKEKKHLLTKLRWFCKRAGETQTTACGSKAADGKAFAKSSIDRFC